MPLYKIALIGANGTLGPSILHALLTSSFAITVLSRASSKSTYPPPIRTTHLSDSLPTSELIPALQGHDALVVAFAGSNDDLQIRLADAAAAAGVKRFIPADFGSCDSASLRAQQLVPIYQAKERVRRHLHELASSYSSSSGEAFSWTSLVCGHFFDYGLQSGLLGFDLAGRKARFFDGGEVRWSTTTLAMIGEAVVRVLRREEETRNRMMYVQSFCVSQGEVLAVLERVGGGKGEGKKWEVEEVRSEEYIQEEKSKIDRNPGDAEATENLVGVLGIVDGNWEGKKDFANGLLGLQGEDLEQVVRRVVGIGE